eukprot:5104967-Heterocapsa_arctica.AAC.1
MERDARVGLLQLRVGLPTLVPAAWGAAVLQHELEDPAACARPTHREVGPRVLGGQVEHVAKLALPETRDVVADGERANVVRRNGSKMIKTRRMCIRSSDRERRSDRQDRRRC